MLTKKQFCYQAVVDPTVVSKEVNDVLKQDAKVVSCLPIPIPRTRTFC